MGKEYWIYIMTNQRNTTPYIGVTNDLDRRVFEHKEEKIIGFCKRYNLDKLVYTESCSNIEDAIRREKQLKRWKRAWKEELINKVNPEWKDLYQEA